MSLLVILDEVLKYIHEEKLREIPLPNPKGLCYKLKRGETSLKTRWQYYLKPMILQYYTNTMFMDIKEDLMKFLVENFESVNKIDWDRCILDFSFMGHTDSSLKYQFHLFRHASRERDQSRELH